MDVEYWWKICMLLKAMEQTKLIKEFPNKGWGCGTEQTFKRCL